MWNVKGTARVIQIIGGVLAMAVVLVPPSASAAPGEILSPLTTFQRTGERYTIWPEGHGVVKLPSGAFLAIADTSKNKHLPGATLLYEMSLARVRKLSSTGQISKRFARSPIGRGIRIGRKNEVTDPKKIFHVRGDTYIAWFTTLGYIVGRTVDWPRSTLIAFDAKTGELDKSFGRGGVMVFGHAVTYTGSVRESFTIDAVALDDGRTITCGQALLNKATPEGIAVVPFANISGLASSKPTGFFAGGSTYLVDPSHQVGDFRNCDEVSALPGGRVAMVGLQATYADTRSYRLFVSMWTVAGERDLSFGTNGETILSFPVSTSWLSHMRVRKTLAAPDGGLYVTGTLNRGSAPRGFVAKLRPDGTIDASYGDAGVAWIAGFEVEDASIAPDGGLFISGARPYKYSAAGWLDASGSWDPNFFGTGWHAYKDTFGYPDLFQLSSGPQAQLYRWSPRPQACEGCQDGTIVRMDNELKLDSSILTATRKGPSLAVRGIAASPDHVVRVEIGTSATRTPPTSWVAAAGTNSWSASIPAPSGKSVYVFSRAIGSGGANIESHFSAADRNRLALR